MILHKPETMDSERKQMLDEFWAEMFLKKIREFDLTEKEKQYFIEYGKKL